MSRSFTVLLVQHSDGTSSKTLRALREAGLAVEGERAETEEQVQAALERRKWDVIVADRHLPRFGALAALVLLKRMGSDVPLLVVDTTIGEEGVAILMRAGARDCLTGEWLERLAPAVEREVAAAEERRRRHDADVERVRADAAGSLRRLAGSAGHDLNNLLQVVQGYGQLALDVTPSSAEARPHLQEILGAVERARSVVMRLLAFSRQDGIPRATRDPDERKQSADQPDAALPGGTETILLAENDESVRGFAVRVLRGAGYQVHVAEDGDEAVRLFEASGDVRLAIIAGILPRTGGKALADRLRRVRPRLPVLFSTGYAFGLMQGGFVPSPDMEIINKPFTHVELLRAVRVLIDAAAEA